MLIKIMSAMSVLGAPKCIYTFGGRSNSPESKNGEWASQRRTRGYCDDAILLIKTSE